MNIYGDPARSEETRMLLQAAIESANDAILITELNLDEPGPRIEYVNPAFTRMTQYTQSEVIGQTPRILQGARTDRALLHRLRDDLKTGSSFHGQTTNYRKDGSEYEVEWRITPVRNREGQPIKWLAVQRDVTERVHAEAALKASEQHLRMANHDLEQFAFAASHDLQGPIRNISLYSELLVKRLGDTLNRETHEILGHITEGSVRLINLIRDLLAYASVGQTHSDAKPIATDLNTVVDTVNRDLAHSIHETTAEITVVGRLPFVSVPNTKLDQLYSNLISNAIKYRKPDEKPRIRCGQVGNYSSDGFVQLYVEDDGIGVDPAYHVQIFGVFKRLHKSDSTGTGIGLAIVQRIVENEGGTVWVESDGHSGSRFCFTLPVSARV